VIVLSALEHRLVLRECGRPGDHDEVASRARDLEPQAVGERERVFAERDRLVLAVHAIREGDLGRLDVGVVRIRDEH